MVCSLEGERMAVMVRLLAAGRLSQNITEEISQHNLASEYRELRDVDEANLLDEEDMHVFESKPMADYLHLVCCNACKKPIMASQYAAHVEICRSLISTKEILMELDGCRGHKKSTRKERKKLPTTPRNPAFTPSTRGGSRVSPRIKDCYASLLTPPAKRSKVIKGEPHLSDGLEVVSGVTKAKSSQDACSYAPAPLATKIYSSQRNNRLRAALGLLYSASGNQICNGSVIAEVSKKNMRHALELIDDQPNSPSRKLKFRKMQTPCLLNENEITILHRVQKDVLVNHEGACQ